MDEYNNQNQNGYAGGTTGQPGYTQYQSSQNQWSSGGYHASFEPPRPVKKGGKAKIALLLAACMVISLAGGFIGGYAGRRAGTSTVIYQAPSDSQTTLTVNQTSSVSDIVDIVKPSVVEITTETVSTSTFWGQYVTSGAGSGVIISEDGYIVTNNHVISGANKITVTTSDGASYDGTLIGTDSRSDIAVVKIEASGLTPAVMGDSDTLKVGDYALVVGNPLGQLGGTVTDGIISALSRDVVVNNETMTLLQTNAAVNPGNSGGGLFDASGRLIGVINAKSSGSDIEGLGFAIPINTAKSVIEDLMSVGYVTGRPAIGVTLIDVTDYRTAMSYQVQYLGVYVQGVSEGSGAQKAGVLSGDYVMSIDGKQVSAISDVTTALNGKSVGDTVVLTVIRDGKTLDLTVVLGEATAAK